MDDGSTEAKTERMLQRRLDKAERLLPGTLGRWVAHLRVAAERIEDLRQPAPERTWLPEEGASCCS